MEENAISVSQISQYFKGIFDAEELLHNISVYGEISGLSILRGNAYFSLKDEFSIMSCVFFGVDNLDIKNGDLIVAKGTPQYYIKGGKLNFNVVNIKPYGVGELFKKYLEIKENLEKEGLFDQFHKKNIPQNVKKIGVITSEKGAVIRDIINVTTRRDKSVNIVLFPTKVQGENADLEIIDGLKFFEKTDVDVVIVARGGGSFEDLMPFNSELLARQVFVSTKPIVSAVGHETDYTIIDFVSDLRAPTPSAAAELVVKLKKEKFNVIIDYYKKINDLIFNKLDQNIINILNLRKDFETCFKNIINNVEYNLGLIIQGLNKLNPLKILNRGYAKIEQNDKSIRSIKDINIKENLDIYLKDGKLITEIKKMEE